MSQSASESAKPALVPQPGGKGALYAGGVPGNRGGGRPPDKVRRKAQRGFKRHISTLERIAGALTEDGISIEGVKASDVVKAIDVMGKYGLGSKKPAPSLDAMRALAGVVQEWADDLGIEATEEQWLDLRQRWFDALGETG